MTIQVTNIDKDTLLQMHGILSRSAGYDISIQDEIDYFDPGKTTAWFLAADQEGEHLGFIRFFEMNSDWSLAEFYIDSHLKNREDVGEKLLQSFKQAASFGSGHRLRFDVLLRDHLINNLLMEKDFSHKKQTFKYFEMDLISFDDIHFKRSNSENINAAQVTEVLSNLTPVDLEEVLSWIDRDQVRFITNDRHIVAAAQISYDEESVEIVRIATHLDFLRQGFAEKLISDICKESFQAEKKKIYLKVDSEKLPAIHLYKKIGLKEIEDKTQFWHSKYY